MKDGDEAPARRRQPPPELAVAMTAAESACYGRQLAAAARLVEFGCGGSTLLAVRSGLERIDSVESDPRWIERCRRHPELAEALAGGRLVLHRADLGRTKAWGYPASDRAAVRWPDYYRSVWAAAGAGPDAGPGPGPDLVLVDGRFRLASALTALLRCPAATRLVIHDFWNRPHYHPLLNFVDHLESAETLAVLRRRAEVDWRALAACLAATALDPR